MVIKVFVSRCSGNMEIKKQQERVLMILDGCKIDNKEIDISDPQREDDKHYMQENSAAAEGHKLPLPPQIFNDDQYCGDYATFQQAIEEDELYEFLKMAPPKVTTDAEISLAEAKEIMNGHTNGHLNGLVNGDSAACRESDREDYKDHDSN